MMRLTAALCVLLSLSGSDSLSEPRLWHAAAQLPDGRVLVTGGRDNRTRQAIASCDMFDPRTSRWNATEPMAAPRWGHVLTTLTDGRALATGSGKGACEIFDPKSGKWIAAGKLDTPRYNHTATLLPDGKVLVAGGMPITGGTPAARALTSAELFDPASGKWSKLPDMFRPRYYHTATPLKDGRVLVAGGLDNPNLDAPPTAGCEIFDPKLKTWKETGALKTPRLWHAAAMLPDGRVLVIGGYRSGRQNSCEIYDPRSGQWSATGGLNEARYDLNAAEMKDGRVVVVSGATGDSTPSLASSEIFNPAKGTWRAGPAVATPRRSHSIWPVGDGKALVVGGWTQWGGQTLASVETLTIPK